MAGLDKILEDIRSESAAAVASVMDAAQAAHDKALREASKEADGRAQKILEHAKMQAQDLIARADSAAALSKRRMMLEAKQELIAEAVARAKERLLTLPDGEYFDLVLKLIAQNALPGEGEVCFSQKDFKRLPKDFASKLVSCLPGGARLNVSSEDVKIEGGFLLKYDGMEQNLSVEEIFEEKKDAMTDAAGKVLFS